MLAAITVAALLVGEVVVSQVCPPSPVGDSCGAQGGSAASNVPSNAGYVTDPVSIGAGHTLHTVADFTVRTPSGSIEFRRYYVSTPDTWSYPHAGSGDGSHFFVVDRDRQVQGAARSLASTPTPFGTAIYPNSLQWWHNFYSLVLDHKYGSTNVWRLVDRAGRTASFEPCAAVGCEAQPTAMYEGTQLILDLMEIVWVTGGVATA